jgi:hypothetical protein
VWLASRPSSSRSSAPRNPRRLRQSAPVSYGSLTPARSPRPPFSTSPGQPCSCYESSSSMSNLPSNHARQRSSPAPLLPPGLPSPRPSGSPSLSGSLQGQQSSSGPTGEGLLTIVRAQIVFLLSTLTEENFAKNQAEIGSVCIGSLLVLIRIQLNVSPSLACGDSRPRSQSSPRPTSHPCFLSRSSRLLDLYSPSPGPARPPTIALRDPPALA